jgi:hypothetical protein
MILQETLSEPVQFQEPKWVTSSVTFVSFMNVSACVFQGKFVDARLGEVILKKSISPCANPVTFGK